MNKLPITDCDYCGAKSVPTINTNGVSRVCESCQKDRELIRGISKDSDRSNLYYWERHREHSGALGY